MSETQAVGTNYIVKTPGISRGEPHISEHRITVAFVVNLYIKQNSTVDEIVEHFGLTLAEIHAALSYYYDHRDEIDMILAEEYAFEQALSEIAPNSSMDAREFARFAITRHSDNPEMTVTEIAKTYGLSTPVVRKAALNGWIPARKSGATWLICRRDAEERWGQRVSKTG